MPLVTNLGTLGNSNTPSISPGTPKTLQVFRRREDISVSSDNLRSEAGVEGAESSEKSNPSCDQRIDNVGSVI